MDRRRIQNGFATAVGDALALLAAELAAILLSWWTTGTPGVPAWTWALIPVWWAIALSLRLLPSWDLGAPDELKRLVFGFLSACAVTWIGASLIGEQASLTAMAATYGLGVVGLITIRHRVKSLLTAAGEWGGANAHAMFASDLVYASRPTDGAGKDVPSIMETAFRRKRRLDLLVLTLAAPVWLPLIGVLSACAWLEDRTSPFARQTRIGRGGEAFRTWRFRTVVPDAADVLRRRLEEDEDLRREWRTNYRLKRDPRVSRVGRVLRRFSLDGVPQLLNVLRGEMALVGPEPLPPYRARQLSAEDQQMRAYFAPGLTGLWMFGSSGERASEDVDAAYMGKWSPWLDLAVLVRTILPSPEPRIKKPAA